MTIMLDALDWTAIIIALIGAIKDALVAFIGAGGGVAVVWLPMWYRRQGRKSPKANSRRRTKPSASGE